MSKAILMFALGLLIPVACAMTYQDAVTEQALYCQMVEEGSWADYKQNFKSVCEE